MEFNFQIPKGDEALKAVHELIFFECEAKKLRIKTMFLNGAEALASVATLEK